MAKGKECVLTDRICNNCGECEICDLNPKKKCNNCCVCIDSKSDYKSVYIDEIIDDREEDTEDLQNWKFTENVEDKIEK
ncbi:MAG: hypothetical protein ACOZCL_16025 [Bacillota bacterium]